MLLYIYSTLPLADPSLIVTSTIRSSHVLPLTNMLADKVPFSLTEYCDWLSDTTVPISDY